MFEERVLRHTEGYRKRESAMAHEHMPPVGQAYGWYRDVVFQVPMYGKKVAHQLARLCGEDSQVTTSYRSLADAVGESDKTGPISYVQRGIRMLVDAGWLRVETIGQKRGASTTFYLVAGAETAYKKKWDDGFYGDDDWLNHHVA